MSTLQTQYPLSPRKFWKKILQKTVVWFFLLFVIAASSFTLLIPVLVHSTQQTASVNVTGYIWSVVLTTLVALAAIMGLYAWYVKAYIRRYYYDANDQFVTIKKGVFAPAEIHVQYQKIQDVYVDQDILDRIMGLYDVHIASATITSGIEAHIDGVDAAGAAGLKTLLLSRLQSGGAASAPMSGAPAQPAAPMGPAKLSEDISTRTYPLVGRWIVLQALKSIFYSLLWTLLLTFYVAVFYVVKVSFSEIVNLVTAAAFTFIIIIYVLRLLYMILWRSTYFFEFLPEYISLRQGIIARNETHVPYRTVQDVIVSQGIVERMLGLATVQIQNAAQQQVIARGRATTLGAGGIVIPGQPTERANHLAELVRGIMLGKNSKQTGL